MVFIISLQWERNEPKRKKRTFWYVRIRKTQISLCIGAGLSCLHWLHEEALLPWPLKMRPVKKLIRKRECAGWSESALGAFNWRYVFWQCGSNIDFLYVQQSKWLARAFFPTILHLLLLGYCKPVFCDHKLESSRYSRWRDFMLDQII